MVVEISELEKPGFLKRRSNKKIFTNFSRRIIINARYRTEN